MSRKDQELALLREFIGKVGGGPKFRLPPERELAVTLGLTRNRLRAGLKKLAAEGMIWRHVGKGTFVGQRSPLISISANDIQDITNPREVMTARLAIEPALARLAAIHATGRDLVEIDNCMNLTTGVHDWENWEQYDCRLHRAIAQSAGNALMMVMFETVQANRNKEFWGRLHNRIEPVTSIERAMSEHREIVKAIRDRDADGAEQVMRKHLRAVERVCFGEG
jgi:DNA-binding FadR family transcriptional regulator